MDYGCHFTTHPQWSWQHAKEETAETLSISRTVADEAVANGDIPCILIGRRILVPKAALAKMTNGSISNYLSG